MEGGLRYFFHPAFIGNGLALGDQLLGGLEPADDLLGCVPVAFHGGVPSPHWPAEDSHSPWTGFRGPSQFRRPEPMLTGLAKELGSDF